MRTCIYPIVLLISITLLTECNDQEQITKNDCQKYIELNQSKSDSLKNDPITLTDVAIVGDCLKLTLQYGGGCKEHQFDLALILPESNTPPFSPPTFELRHNANNDLCKALITKEYSFDISGIQETGKNKTDFIIASKNSSGVFENTTYTYSY